MSQVFVHRLTQLEALVRAQGERLAAMEARYDEIEHLSSCAVNNGPALPAGSCDCKDAKRARRR